MITQFLINGFITGFLYAVIALAFSLTYNTTKVFHIAYAPVLVFGGYFMLVFKNLSVPVIIAMLLTIFLCGLLNLLIEKVIYQPMEQRKNTKNTILVASIGVFIFLTNFIALLFGNENQVLNQSIYKGLEIGDLIITRMQVIQFAVSVFVITLLLLVLNKTSLGIKIKALSENLNLYQSFGFNAISLRDYLYFISGIVAGIVSLSLAFDIGFDPYFGIGFLLNALVAMIIGGFGSYKGCVIGGILLGIIQSLSVYFFEAKWETAITFSVFLLLLILRPRGLFGKKIRLV